MTEIWKDIEGYNGIYQISNLGRVKSLGNTKNKKDKIIKPVKNNKGYLRVSLHKSNTLTRMYVHRLVAIAFIPNINNYPQINHIDENKSNNCVDNLEWCTAKYNCNYGTKNKTTSKKVVCVETGKIYNSTREIERKLCISHTCISDCCNGKQKTAGGYHWEYMGGESDVISK